MGVGMPDYMYLNEFGSKIADCFGTLPFHVGSSMTGKSWRDVDVRLILSDEDYKRFGFLTPIHYSSWDAKLISLSLAYSALGAAMTGLPIDFQIQQRTYANEKYSNQPRSALGMIPSRVELPKDKQGCQEK